jgi:hypothetical protein
MIGTVNGVTPTASDADGDETNPALRVPGLAVSQAADVATTATMHARVT